MTTTIQEMYTTNGDEDYITWDQVQDIISEYQLVKMLDIYVELLTKI